MGNSLRFKTGKYDDIIKGILRGKEMTLTELVKKCEEYGIPNSTAYRRIKQFLKLHEFESVEYITLARKYEEADAAQVRHFFEALVGGSSVDVLDSRLQTLGFWSRDQRVAHHPRVIMDLETLLEKTAIIENESLFEKVMFLLYYMLKYERTIQPPDSKIYINELKGEILNKVLTILGKMPRFPKTHALQYLRETGELRAIDTIFEKIRLYPQEVNVDSLSFALSKNGSLYNEHSLIIEKRIDELLSQGSTYNDIMIELRRRIHQA